MMMMMIVVIVIPLFTLFQVIYNTLSINDDSNWSKYYVLQQVKICSFAQVI